MTLIFWSRLLFRTDAAHFNARDGDDSRDATLARPAAGRGLSGTFDPGTARAPGAQSTVTARGEDHVMTTIDTSADTRVAGRTADPVPAARVLAGVDGSGCSRKAAFWAAEEALARGAHLLLVAAYWMHTVGYTTTAYAPTGTLTELREAGETALRDVAGELRHRHPGLDVATRLRYGEPSRVLREEAADADLTVIGNHGSHRLTTTLGSVAGTVVASNPGPVAVIRPGTVRAHGPVVVGVDGSADADHALGYAFAAARRLGSTLVTVACWSDPTIDGPFPAYGNLPLDLTPLADATAAELTQRLAPWRTRYPDVPVEARVEHSRPVRPLLEAGRHARLLVVGTRGRGKITGLLLGSTSQSLIAHAECPVVVVPGPRP